MAAGTVAIVWLEPKDFTLHNASTANDTGTTVDLGAKYASLTLQVKVASSWDGTGTFQGSQDGTNFIAVEVINRNSGARVTTATADAIFETSVVGLKKFRFSIASRTTGNVTVTATATSSPVSVRA